MFVKQAYTVLFHFRLDFDECADAMHDNQLLNTQHSPTDVPGGTMSSPSTPNMKIAMDISTQELSHPPSPSPSHPTPTTSPQRLHLIPAKNFSLGLGFFLIVSQFDVSLRNPKVVHGLSEQVYPKGLSECCSPEQLSM